ncbi:70 kDa peptidyl-prolyl isomerase-like [Silene latifolia]|uniref:70 kDa peptidyl-prolyl isomerase-like n=1 Tax=Silene latifolia TaxID=37657 RepID=UPI003D787253
MASNRVCVKFLESFACSHLDDDFFEDEGWDMMNCIMQTKGSPIPKIKDLKDKGNNLYKQNCFGAAASCYDEACKLLSLVVGMENSYDTNTLSELAVSLNLNLAACALKLFEHEASKDHCSIVLSFFPTNVKALFRRGLAFMKLNKFLEAKSDLEAALLVEPRNKDILRELCVVKDCLAINLNGKRSIDEHPLQDSTGNGKVKVHDDEPL